MAVEVGLDRMVMQFGQRKGRVVLHAQQYLAAAVGEQVANLVGQFGGASALA